jgi:hypothetical protein
MKRRCWVVAIYSSYIKRNFNRIPRAFTWEIREFLNMGNLVYYSKPGFPQDSQNIKKPALPPPPPTALHDSDKWRERFKEPVPRLHFII